MTKLSRRIFMLPAALACLPSFAQTPPDAGALQRDTERAARPPVPAVPPPAPQAPMPEAAKGATVLVRAFAVEGATLIPAAELAALLDDQVGKSLSLAELERAARRIAEHYRQRGWFARVYLPAQDVSAGVVRIVVVEGRLGAIKLERSGERADADLARGIAAGHLAPGEPLRAEALERGLLLANELPGMRVTGILEPGGAIGETDLRLKLEDSPLLDGDAGLSNYGARATGAAQLSAGVNLNPGNGGQFGLRALASEHLDWLRIHYALPLGDDGLRLQFHTSELRYTLGGEFAALHASGDARTLGARLSYPWLRSETANLGIALAPEARRYADDVAGSPLRRKRADAIVASLSGDASDAWFGGGLTQGEAALTAGRLDLSGVAADQFVDAAGPRAEGRYAKLDAHLSRLQSLSGGFSLSAAFAVQWANKNLDSSEKFVLGGPDGVRAYPVNEAAGDEGWLLKLELRKNLGDWTAFLLADAGEIRQYRNEWPGRQGTGNTAPNRYGLAGAGFGLAWAKPGDLAVQLTFAAPLGANPGHTAAGRNQDGSARAPRGWLRLVKYF
jgi:hemolysin activation/secretion protein